MEEDTNTAKKRQVRPRGAIRRHWAGYSSARILSSSPHIHVRQRVSVTAIPVEANGREVDEHDS